MNDTRVTNMTNNKKYNFAPSFNLHQNLNLESNAQYRKFKSNKNSSNAHKIEGSAKIKKAFKYKINKREENAYECNELPEIYEVTRIKDVHDLQIEGDHSISISKETDEAIVHDKSSKDRPLTLTPGKNVEKLINSKKTSGYVKDSFESRDYENYSGLEIRNESPIVNKKLKGKESTEPIP